MIRMSGLVPLQVLREAPDAESSVLPNIPDDKPDEGSPAHQQAMQMGLVYKGFGRYADPNTNQIVALSANQGQQLIKPDPAGTQDTESGTDQQPSTSNADLPAATPVPGDAAVKRGRGRPRKTPLPTSGPNIGNSPAPGQAPWTTAPEPREKDALDKTDFAVDSLISRAGSADKAKAFLMKRAAAGNAAAEKMLVRFDAAQARDQEWAQQAAAKIRDQEAAKQAALKSKYASKYPSPQI